MDAVMHSAFCGACGRPASERAHERCPELLRFDPPRFCARCGSRLDVQVYPAGVEASCRRCDGRPGARKAR